VSGNPSSTFEFRRPPQPAGMGRGALMALVVHIGLLVAVAFGVHWRSSEPAGASAELWSAVPQVAAPAAAEPPPPPPLPKPMAKVEPTPVEAPPPPKPDTRDADIAIEKAKAAAEKERRDERERQERLEKERAEKLERERAEKIAKAEREKQERAEREKQERAEREKQEKAEREAVARTEAARQKNLERMLGQAGATGAPQSTGTAQRDAGPSANYAGKIVARVRPNIVLTDSVPPTLRAEVEVRAAPDGTITGRRLVKPSGNATWDEAVLRAIDRTDSLPKDDNGRVPSSILIAFTPA
jgi:colicin import membrane protein